MFRSRFFNGAPGDNSRLSRGNNYIIEDKLLCVAALGRSAAHSNARRLQMSRWLPIASRYDIRDTIAYGRARATPSFRD